MTSDACVEPSDRRGDGAPLTDSLVSARVSDRDRLLALRRTGLLDSREEEAFDRLTRRACRLIGVPVALVSLVCHDRQFFKSAQGLREPFASTRQTPLSHSFCQYVVARESPLLVSDAREVPLLADSPAITDLDVIGYAGVPFRAHGFVLGAVCAIDAVAHEWSDADLALLQELASACSDEVHVRGVLRERRRAQAEQRFDALNGALNVTGYGAPRPRSGIQAKTIRAPHAGASGDNRRWLRPELAIPSEAVMV